MSWISWRNNWERLTVYFQYSNQIQKVIYTINLIKNFLYQLRKIIRNTIRLKSYDIRDQMMRIATALHNLRFSFRKAIQNDS